MLLKLDLHIHTSYSYDGFATLKEILAVARLKGLDGVAITDHDVIGSSPKALKSRRDMIMIPGIEVSTKEGHLIGLGITDVIKPRLSALETAEEIRRKGGIVVVPHPYDVFTSSIRPKKAEEIKPDAIEVVNSSDPLFYLTSKLARRLADRLQVAKVAGSDAHLLDSVGKAYTIFDSDSANVEDLLEAIKGGKVTVRGSPISLMARLRRTGLMIKRGLGSLGTSRLRL